ncbi:ornithine cyclodeaminase family protein, partial [Candidatus Parcubacteria bacterium]
MFVLNARDVRRALPMRDAIQAMKQAFRAFSAGQAEVPLRGRLSIPPHQAVTLT